MPFDFVLPRFCQSLMLPWFPSSTKIKRLVFVSYLLWAFCVMSFVSYFIFLDICFSSTSHSLFSQKQINESIYFIYMDQEKGLC
jgi:lipopolysaccharide/colanic/teichoic acid biosynthesis glycosyltransferase